VERTEGAAVETSWASTPRAVRAFALGLGIGAVGAGVALLAAGSSRPALGPVLLLAVATALCVNRFALFPSEHAATAEAAVLLTAVVGFHATAPYLGPLAIALLVGPLDGLHWEQRSWLRMAYNTGNRSVATLAAAATCAGLHEGLGNTAAAWVGVVLGSALAFVVVDVGLSALLFRLRGSATRVALTHALDVDALAWPLACVGGAIGLLALDSAWWIALLALLPIAYVPEVVVARARRHASAVRNAGATLLVLAIVGTVAWTSASSTTVAVALLCLLAVIVGVELDVDDDVVLSPLVAVVIVPTCALLRGVDVRLGAFLVVAVALGTQWWCARPRLEVRLLAVAVVGVAAALAAAEVALALPRLVDGSIPGALASTFVVGLTVEAVCVAANRGRRRGIVALGWTLPLLGAAAAGAGVWGARGAATGIAVTAALVISACVGWAAWGAPTWPSRVAARIGVRITRYDVPRLVRVCVLAAVVAATLGVCVSSSAATAWAWTAVGLGQLAVVMTASAVRQWRFAPRPRVVGWFVVLSTSVALTALGGPLGARGDVLGVVVVVVAMAAVTVVARRPAQVMRAHDSPLLEHQGEP
jgi:hypothetical protein